MITKYNKFKLYEYKEIPTSGKESRDFFIERLYNKIKEEIIPNIPKDFDIYYDKGKEIIIKTDNDKELSVGVKVDGDNISFYANPVGETGYEYNFGFNPFSINEIFGMVKDAFEKSKNFGLINKPVRKNLTDPKEASVKDIIKDKKNRPNRVKRSVSIKIVEHVLAEYFVDDQLILLGGLTVEGLIKEMIDLDTK